MTFDAGAGFLNYFWPASRARRRKALSSTVPIRFRSSSPTSMAAPTKANVVWVSVDPLPAPAIITKGDMEIDLVSSAEAQYQWYHDGQLVPGANNQAITPTESGNYQVMVTDTNGCSMISGIFHLDLDIYDAEMYQGISPNGDGVNDHLTIPEIEYYPDNQFMVFNRWGAQVFGRKAYLNEFDGHDDGGRDLPDGVYYYVLDLGNGSKPVKGYFVINR